MPGFFSKYYWVLFVYFFAYELFRRGGEYYINHFSRKYENSL